MTLSQKTGRIFGIGLNKTGTTTLGRALNMLGVKTIDYPTDARTLEQLEKGDYRLDILDEYEAVTDMPVGMFYPQLDPLYPGSKFILTVRERKAWLESVRDHWPFVMEWGKHDEPFRSFTYYAFVSVYGSLEYNESRYGYVFDRYHHDVFEYFKDRADDLLVMDICAGDGWDKLCPFLNLPIPSEPWPHLNKKEEKRDRQLWIDRLKRVYAELDRSVPTGQPLILVDEDKFAGSLVHKLRATYPFPERDGKYNGLPCSSDDAIAELERQALLGRNYIAISWPAFWWLEHYSAFAQLLRRSSSMISETEDCIVLKLKDR